MASVLLPAVALPVWGLGTAYMYKKVIEDTCKRTVLGILSLGGYCLSTILISRECEKLSSHWICDNIVYIHVGAMLCSAVAMRYVFTYTPKETSKCHKK